MYVINGKMVEPMLFQVGFSFLFYSFKTHMTLSSMKLNEDVETNDSEI